MWLYLLPEGMPIERGLKLHLQSLMVAECPDVVPTAVAAGDAETIIQFLTKFPYEVRNHNNKAIGKTHNSCVQSKCKSLYIGVSSLPIL